MKIIFSDNNLKMLLNFRGEIIRYYVAQGHEVLLIYPQCTREQQKELLLPDDVRCMGVFCDPTGNNPFKDLKYLCALYRIYKREKPDLIFHYTIKPNIYGTLAARLAGISNCVSMVAGLGYVFHGRGITKWIARCLYKLGLRLSARVITLNAANQALLLSRHYLSRERSVLFDGGEGVNLNYYAYRKNNFQTVRFLMVARVLYDKGYREFVEAAKIVRKQYPAVVCELLGPIDSKSPMRVPEDIIRRDVDSGAIDYLGVSDDVPALVGRDGVVVVCSSYHEGLNRSLMEACAMGRPIIASDIPGCRESVHNNGYLVPPKNAQELADAMCRFVAISEADRQKMARASYELAKSKFDIQHVIAAYEALVASLNIPKK